MRKTLSMRRFRRGVFGWFSRGHRVRRRTACGCSGSSHKRGHAGWPHLPRRETGPEGGRRQPGALSFCLFSEPPRKAAVPLVNSLSLGAGLLAHCSENSLSRLPSKGKTSTEPPSGRVGSATLVRVPLLSGLGPQPRQALLSAVLPASRLRSLHGHHPSTRCSRPGSPQAHRARRPLAEHGTGGGARARHSGFLSQVPWAAAS